MADLHDIPAVALRDLLRQGQVSAVDVASHFLARIEQRNPLLGAFVTVTAEQALEQARAADNRRFRSWCPARWLEAPLTLP